MQPYHSLNTPFPNNGERPFTANDFERLLNLLVHRNQKHQRFNFMTDSNSFSNDFNGYGGHFSGYIPNYQKIPSPPLYNQFDPRHTPFNRFLPPLPPTHGFYAPYSEQENMYQAQNPKQYYIQNDENSDTKDSAQQKVCTQENNDYLPSNVREELLYRMLMLAIQPDISSTTPGADASTIQEYFKAKMPVKTTLSEQYSIKPVRSVQVLGDE